MSDLVNPAKPMLVSRCNERLITIGDDQEAFEQQLIAWMATCVTSRTINPGTNKPYRREIVLVEDATGVQEIFDYAKAQRSRPAGMTLGKNNNSGQYKVKAHYTWGRWANGGWFVRGVGFSIRGDVSWKPPPEPPDPEFKVRDVVFGITPRRVETYSVDLQKGKELVKEAKDAIHEEAKKDAKLPDNPIKAPDAKDMAKGAAKVIKGGNPAGQLGKCVVGLMLEAARMNMAGDVAAKRKRGYANYALGFMSVIALQSANPLPSDEFSIKYFKLGQNTAHKLTDEQKYQVQLYLMRYASENPPSGWKIPKSRDWKYPDDFLTHWSPEQMGEALYNQLSRIEYSVD